MEDKELADMFEAQALKLLVPTGKILMQQNMGFESVLPILELVKKAIIEGMKFAWDECTNQHWHDNAGAE